MGRDGEAHFPPGLIWIRWGRSLPSPGPCLQPGGATSRRRRGLQAPEPAAEGARPHGNATRSPAWSTPGAEEGLEEEAGPAVPSESAPSFARLPRAPAAVVSPKAEGALGQNLFAGAEMAAGVPCALVTSCSSTFSADRLVQRK